jgi:hypothetical protein
LEQFDENFNILRKDSESFIDNGRIVIISEEVDVRVGFPESLGVTAFADTEHPADFFNRVNSDFIDQSILVRQKEGGE